MLTRRRDDDMGLAAGAGHKNQEVMRSMQVRQSKSSSSMVLAMQRQVGSVLTKLRKGIRGLENELAQLLRHEQMLAQLAGRKVQKRTVAGRTRASTGGYVPGGRIDWKNVLAQLPSQFKASNVRQVRGLADKRPSEIFAGITRWIEAGSVKRKERGLYERVAHKSSSVRL